MSKNRCRAVCTTKNNELVHVRRGHEHAPHWSRIGNRPLFNEEDDLDDIIEPKDSLATISKINNKIYGTLSAPTTMEYKYYIEECP